MGKAAVKAEPALAQTQLTQFAKLGLIAFCFENTSLSASQRSSSASSFAPAAASPVAVAEEVAARLEGSLETLTPIAMFLWSDLPSVVGGSGSVRRGHRRGELRRFLGERGR